MKKNILFILAIIMLLPLVTGAQITSSPTTTAEVAKEWTYQVQVDTDLNITYALEENPSNMNINNTGFVSWVPTQEGQYPVNISIYNESNNAYLTSQEFTLAVVATPANFVLSNVELGSNNLERGFRETETKTISNSGSFAITNVQVSHTIPERYNAVINTAGNTINPYSDLVMTVSYDVPENENSGRKRIGTITLTGESQGQNLVLNREVYLTARNELIIEEVEVRIDGRRERMTSDGLIDRQAKIDSNIELNIRLFNDADTDMEDIDIELFSPDIRDADGLDDFIRTLRPGRTESIRFTFELDPSRIEPEDQPYEIEINVVGIDENNARHGETWILELELDVERRDIRFIRTRISPTTVSCENPRFNLETEIRNVGQRDLDQAMIRATIMDLNINQLRRDIDIFWGDTRTYNIGFEIPRDTTPGEYFVEVYAHPTRSVTDYTDTDILSFTVLECPTDVVDEEPEEEEVEETETPPPVVIGQPIERTEERTFLGDDTYVLILTALVVMLAAIVVIMFVQLTKK